MTGGYPCCCQERFGSSVSGAESEVSGWTSGLPPGSFDPGSSQFVPCPAICSRRATARVRIDVELARSRVSVSDCPPSDMCDDIFNGTYFLESAYRRFCTCRWYYQFGYTNQYIELCLRSMSVNIYEPFVRIEVDIGSMCSWGFDVTASFRKDVPGECITLQQLHGMVLPVYPNKTTCSSSQGKATIYLL